MLRTVFYFALLVGAVLTCHYMEPDFYKPVREHTLYKDFVEPAITTSEEIISPLLSQAKPMYDKLAYEVMRIPQVAELFGVDPREVSSGRVPASESDNSAKAKKVEFADAGSFSKSHKTPGSGQAFPDEETDRDIHSQAPENLQFSEPSQMRFSLAQLGVEVEKRSVLSTEGEAANFFELPDGSRLWLAPNTVVEAGWVGGERSDETVMLLRVETGLMHVKRHGGSSGRLYIVTNSGIRHSVNAADAWLAASQIGAVDKEQYPDAEKITSNNASDYVRRASLVEAKSLLPVIVADRRREKMLLQDKLRVKADKEEYSKEMAISNEQVLPVEITSIPLEIPSRSPQELGGGGRMPASVSQDEVDNFPARRAPASVLVGMDEATALSTEAQIKGYVNRNQCSTAIHVYKKTIERYDLGRGDRWRNKVRSTLQRSCAL